MTDSGCESSGPECWRHVYLEKCMENFVKSHRDKPGSCKRLRKVFSDIYQRSPEALLYISTSFGDKYVENVMKAVKALLEMSEMRERLERLETFPENVTLWRPSGEPEKDMRAHVALASQSEIQDLEQQLMEEEEELQKLKAKLPEKDNEIKKKLLHVNALAEELTGASRVALSNQENLINLIKAAAIDVQPNP